MSRCIYTATFGFRMPFLMRKQLRELANKQNRHEGEIVRAALAIYLEKPKQEQRHEGWLVCR